MHMAFSDAERCTAKAKTTGRRCKSPAVVGMDKCRMHGGKSVSGASSGTYRTGRYSKAIPERLAARYAEAQSDDRLTEMREEIALLDARLSELLSRLDTGESGAIWSALMKAKHQFETAHPGEKQMRLTMLLGLIDEGHDDRLNWAEIGDSVEAAPQARRERAQAAQRPPTDDDDRAGHDAARRRRRHHQRPRKRP